ncbi:MAG TPA: Hsp20/alpha crystallin family protein [Epsilonproteobacteria bacterium]|nr:Hsp20/alpha crystallin family protein [Campylobacterota bacterium]
MEIIKHAKDFGKEIEKGVEVVGKKVTDAFDNLASHLPFSNLAKKESGDFHLEVDLPGVKKEDVNIRIEDDVLVVNAIRYYQNELSREDYYICESAFGKFERQYVLPDNVDKEKVDASFKDGRLVIELEKTQAAKARRIAVK